MSKIGRDAGSGLFTPVKVARENPKTHVVETIKHAPPKAPSPAPKTGKR